ncbi:hypothetical protein SFMTTN_2429 [Sulfuriferula multivorans]|uniref:Uncharacterized protein n=1 Tax=Sulfuriferula multivorans TaxID=1559896 RepID=A0A401JG69_9PROT|nr:hypothetical protein SFMTTN_2429 [Sulfuriferula multivorans]
MLENLKRVELSHSITKLDLGLCLDAHDDCIVIGVPGRFSISGSIMLRYLHLVIEPPQI